MQDENQNIVNESDVEYEDLSGSLMEKPFDPNKIDITTRSPSIDILICATPSSNVEDFNSRVIDESYGPYIFDITDFTTCSSMAEILLSSIKFSFFLL